MHVSSSALPGVMFVQPEPLADARGFFARLHCERELAAAGLDGHFVQTSLSYTARRGTLRGLHFQWPPSHEAKLVRCLVGRVFDVVVDLRPDSVAFGRHLTVELDARDRGAVYIPPGCAHGFQALADDSEVLYQMTDFHAPALAAGVRWDDPAFAIAWPLAPTALHPRDAAYAAFDAPAFGREVALRGGWRAAI